MSAKTKKKPRVIAKGKNPTPSNDRTALQKGRPVPRMHALVDYDDDTEEDDAAPRRAKKPKRSGGKTDPDAPWKLRAPTTTTTPPMTVAVGPKPSPQRRAAPKLTPLDIDKDDENTKRFAKGDLDAAEKFLTRYDENTRTNLQQLMEYVVALHMLDAFDCFLATTRDDCDQHERCRWTDKEVAGCVSRDDPSIHADTMAELKQLKGMDPKHMKAMEHVRLETLRSLHMMSRKMFVAVRDLADGVAKLENRIDNDLKTLRDYVEHLIPRKARTDPTVWRSTEIAMWKLDERIDAETKRLEGLVRTLRTLLNDVDGRIVALAEEWAREDITGERLRLNPITAIAPLIKRVESVVGRYHRQRKQYPVPKKYFASKKMQWWG